MKTLIVICALVMLIQRPRLLKAIVSTSGPFECGRIRRTGRYDLTFRLFDAIAGGNLSPARVEAKYRSYKRCL